MAPSFTQSEFEYALNEGIACAKAGERASARRLLNRAIAHNSADVRPYMWLARVTDDPQEQRSCLEQVVSMDPSNAAARQALAALKGITGMESRIPDGGREGMNAEAENSEREPQAVESHPFTCPQCGGRTAFQIASASLTCEYCGYRQLPVERESHAPPDPYLADKQEQVLDFAIPTRAGHAWARNRQWMTCTGCGAAALLPPGSLSIQCPYCGGNALTHSAAEDDFIDPQLVAPLKIDERQARRQVRAWLGKGWLAPDDLARVEKNLRPRLAFYSAWTFDGAVELNIKYPGQPEQRAVCGVGDEDKVGDRLI